MPCLTLHAHNEIHIGDKIVVRLNEKQVRKVTKVRVVIEAPCEIAIYHEVNSKPAQQNDTVPPAAGSKHGRDTEVPEGDGDGRARGRRQIFRRKTRAKVTEL